MSAIQDLEQEFLKCWEIVDDLRLLAEEVNNGSDFTNTLKGVAELYHYKFDKAWKSFEQLVEDHYELRNKIKELNDGIVE